jgi:hypothetical protein
MMNGDFQVFPEALSSLLTPLVLLLLCVAFLLWINHQRLRNCWLQFTTRSWLDRLGPEQLTAVQCLDGLDDHCNIDRLLLRHEVISVLVEKRYAGRMFAAEGIDQWTRMPGQRSYSLRNPLHELELQVRAVAACFPGVEVDGYLFFDHGATFPRDWPRRLIHPQHIPEELQPNHRHRVNPRVLQAWKEFSSQRSTA